MTIRKTFLFLTIALLGFASCGEEENKEPEKEIIPENIKKTDLSEYDLPFFIYTEKIKDENGVPLNMEVLHEEAGLDWEIILGKSFDILVEDWGSERKDPLKEIQRMEELEQHYEYKYIEKTNDYVLYSKGIPGDESHVDYHFFHTIDGGDNYYYSIKSNPMTQFTLDEIKVMLEASKSLKPVPANSEEPTV